MAKRSAEPKGKAKKESDRALDLQLEDFLWEADLNATFVDSVSPEVADDYRRLNADQRLVPVFEKLKQRGASDKEIEILMRGIARIPPGWETENEGWNQGVKRRAAMTKKLRKLANLVAADPDLKGLCLPVDNISLNCPPEHQGELETLAEILNMAASFLEPSDLPLVMTMDGKLLTSQESERLNSPERRVSEQSYTLLRIFELLELYFERTPNSNSPRAPNRETEILGAVLLQTDIKPGTVTKLRKKERRKYYRDPE